MGEESCGLPKIIYLRSDQSLQDKVILNQQLSHSLSPWSHCSFQSRCQNDLQARLEVIDPLLVELGKLEQQQPVLRLKLLLGHLEGLPQLLRAHHIRPRLLQLLLLLQLALELLALTAKLTNSLSR